MTSQCTSTATNIKPPFNVLKPLMLEMATYGVWPQFDSVFKSESSIVWHYLYLNMKDNYNKFMTILKVHSIIVLLKSHNLSIKIVYVSFLLW